ncbi:MAG: Uma2 family endonuclease [Leptolyngbyaceae bacterium]|nr:Uma2 family endonuclease [Leptolyngbyaceae bacterium]
MVTLQLNQIRVLPGQRLLLENVSWREFQAILQELGEHRATRLSYSRGILEIVAPLPEHEKAKVILGDLLKALLDELDMNWESLGSTTFQREDMKAGIEPDDCFYIQHHALMIGKDRIDLTVDPPPDLAIEVDVTSKTKLSAYELLQVPEIWRYQNRKLQINLLQNGKYVESPISLIVPNLPVLEGIAQFLEMSRVAGTAPALRGFRRWVREQIHGR